eukprot:440565_1
MSFNIKIFGLWFFEAIIHSIIVFFTAVIYIDSTNIPNSGQLVGYWTSSTTMFTSIVTVVTIKIMFETKTWTWISIIFFIISYLSWYIVTLTWNAIPIQIGLPNWSVYAVSQIAMNTAQFWFVIIITTVLCIYPDILIQMAIKLYKPTRYDVIAWLEQKPNKRQIFINQIEEYIESKKPKINIQKTIDNNNNNDESNEEKDMPILVSTPKIKSMKSDLGYSEFQVGNDHIDYVVSQHKYISAAMTQKTFTPSVKSNNNNNNMMKTRSITNTNTNPKFTYSHLPNIDQD